MPCLQFARFPDRRKWNGNAVDKDYLAQGLVYLKEDDAIARSLAMKETCGWNLNEGFEQPVAGDVMIEIVTSGGLHITTDAGAIQWEEVADEVFAWRCV